MEGRCSLKVPQREYDEGIDAKDLNSKQHRLHGGDEVKTIDYDVAVAAAENNQTTTRGKLCCINNSIRNRASKQLRSDWWPL